MSIFKFLIYTILSTASLPADESTGWFPVEKAQKREEQTEEDDPSIWVLFAKSLGSEKFLVRFPQEPQYLYAETGEFTVTSEGEGGETYQLTVQKRGPDQELPEIHYQSEGKWVHESFLQTEEHLYHLKTTSHLPGSKSYQEFFTSLFIEKNG